jgi:hypothetical protein
MPKCGIIVFLAILLSGCHGDIIHGQCWLPNSPTASLCVLDSIVLSLAATAVGTVLHFGMKCLIDAIDRRADRKAKEKKLRHFIAQLADVWRSFDQNEHAASASELARSIERFVSGAAPYINKELRDVLKQIDVIDIAIMAVQQSGNHSDREIRDAIELMFKASSPNDLVLEKDYGLGTN